MSTPETHSLGTPLHCTSSDVGGALRLAGTTTIRDCSFVYNMATNSGLAVAAVGSVEINGSYFHKNVFSCVEGQYLDEVRQVCKTGPVSFFIRGSNDLVCSAALQLQSRKLGMLAKATVLQ